VVLDTVSYLGHGARRTGRGYYEGRLDERQLTWLANDLALVPPERLLVLAMHIPLRSYFTEDPAGVSVENLDALLEILAGREAVLAVAGHLHNNEHHHLSRADGFDSPVPLHLHTLAAVSGSWWSGPPDERGIPWALQSDGTPNGYHVMMVDGTRVQMRYRAAGRPAEHQMRISFETARDDGRRSGRRRARSRDGVPVGRVGLDRVPATEILVNLFDGGPASRVDVRVGEREPVEMTRVRRPDPFVERLLRQHGKTMKSFVRAVPCSHLWSAGLPDDLGPGVHAIQVTASDDYGQRHEGRAILEVE
jgi:hypothetical protein